MELHKDVGPLCPDAADVSHLGDLINSVMMADFANLHENVALAFQSFIVTS